MKITICASMKFMEKMLEAKKSLEDQGHEVLLPVWENLHISNISKSRLLIKKRSYILEHFKKIKSSDAVLVLNITKNSVKNYIGGNSLIEIGIAFDQGKKIFLYNSLPKVEDISYVTEIETMKPFILNGDLSKIE